MELKGVLSSLNLAQADWVGLRKVTETTTIHSIRDLKPDQHSRNISSGLMIEVLYKGQFAYAATPNTSLIEVQHAFDRALRDARQAASYGIYKFNEEVRPSHQGEYRSPCQISFNNMTVEEINQFVKTAEPGDRVIYYRGFLAEDAGLSKEKRDFASFVLSLESEKKVLLVQKKIRGGAAGNEAPIYEYIAEKRKT